MFNKNEFKAQIARSGKTIKETAKYLGINESTMYRKVQADGNFTREEINKLIEFLQIERPEEVFFAHKLA
ncbi:MAG: DUF739 domain-containing protein [Lachnospiraceae bacterium]|nr:DUF739 domain-containing protein [Lachnospiraceae bacterium]